MKRRNKTEQVGDIIISQIIGDRPRKPQTYQIKMRLGTKEDLDFCKRYDDRLKKWEDKAENIREKAMKIRAKDIQIANEFYVAEVPPIILRTGDIYNDFIKAYKYFYKKDFNPKNIYSNTHEPQQYVYTLILYFMRDNRFLDSPLLNTQLSAPSFDKGTLTIGGVGCGKTSIFTSLVYAMNSFCTHVRKTIPKNQQDLLQKYEINSCISSDIVNKYNTTDNKSYLDEIMKPLMSLKQLYIDDILREQDANNYGIRNLFLDVLTHRADRNLKTHLTLNYLDKNEGLGIKAQDLEISLGQFANRYDFRVHDRLFGSYNIIQLTGKSFRR